MKRKLILFCKAIIFLALLCGVMFVTSLVVEHKASYEKNQVFFEEAEKGHIDALIFGSTHVMYGLNPIQLYRDYGITSYNFGSYAGGLLPSYWEMMMALDYCTPKLVIVDAHMLEDDVRYADNEGSSIGYAELHQAIDRFPLNKTKIDAINDMFENQDNKYPFLVDYIIYHDRWRELTENDFKRLSNATETGKLMGGSVKYDIHSAEYTYQDFGIGYTDEDTVGATYLKKIIEECKSRDIEVLVMTTPYLALQEGQFASRTAEKIAEEYGVHSINFLKGIQMIDHNMDMADGSHLNILGTTKVTDYVGNYIDDNMDIPDHREDEGYESWNEAMKEYDESIQDMIHGTQNIYRQLLVLKLFNNYLDYTISIRGGTMVYADEKLVRLLKSLGAYGELDRAIENKKSYIMISDHGNLYECAGDFDDPVRISTDEGTLEYIAATDLYRILYLNGDYENNLLYSDEHAYTDVQLLFFYDDELVAHQYYTSDHFDYSYQEDVIEKEDE